MFCQLEALRHCLPPSVRRTLDELPESLDETYERVLKEIKKPNRDHARRLLLCLVAAIRPLDVKELAEVLAVDFDDAEGIPKLKPNWRWEDEEQALLSSCSTSGKLHPLRLRALGLLLCILVLVGPFATSAFDFRYFSFFFGYFGFF